MHGQLPLLHAIHGWLLPGWVAAGHVDRWHPCWGIPLWRHGSLSLPKRAHRPGTWAWALAHIGALQWRWDERHALKSQGGTPQLCLICKLLCLHVSLMKTRSSLASDRMQELMHQAYSCTACWQLIPAACSAQGVQTPACPPAHCLPELSVQSSCAPQPCLHDCCLLACRWAAALQRLCWHCLEVQLTQASA